MSNPLVPVPGYRNQNAAAFNSLLSMAETYRKVFRPAVKSQMNPTAIEQLFQSHATRGAGLLNSLDRLDGAQHFQSSAATIRLLFEIAVEVQLLDIRSKLGIAEDPNDDTVRRHDLAARCALLKWSRGFANCPRIAGNSLQDRSASYLQDQQDLLDSEVAKYTTTNIMGKLIARAPRSVRESRGETGRETMPVKPGRAFKFQHWLNLNLSERVDLLDRFGDGSKFRDWYTNEYGIASVYTHGSLSLLGKAGTDDITNGLTILYYWCVEVCCDSIMLPIFDELKLNTPDSEAWQRIAQAKDMAMSAGDHFLSHAPEIWQQHLKSEGMS